MFLNIFLVKIHYKLKYFNMKVVNKNVFSFHMLKRRLFKQSVIAITVPLSFEDLQAN